jgi:hypothetical protein
MRDRFLAHGGIVCSAMFDDGARCVIVGYGTSSARAALMRSATELAQIDKNRMFSLHGD